MMFGVSPDWEGSDFRQGPLSVFCWSRTGVLVSWYDVV